MAQAIPAGHHTITPHLVIKGASEAIEFYKRAFGAEEVFRMPFPGPDGQVKLGHAELRIGDSVLYLADEFPQQGVTGPNGHSPVSLEILSKAHYVKLGGGFGPKLIAEVPLVETVPGAPDASVLRISVKVGWPVATSRTRTVPSPTAEARRLPSGLKATPSTELP